MPDAAVSICTDGRWEIDFLRWEEAVPSDALVVLCCQSCCVLSELQGGAPVHTRPRETQREALSSGRVLTRLGG